MINTENTTVARQNSSVDDGNDNCRYLYGDNFSKNKAKKTLRIVFQNINGLGTSEETDKRDFIREFINTYKIDCFCMAEVNTNWKIVARKESLSALAKKWFRHSRVITAHNVVSNTKFPHQQGGVAGRRELAVRL